MGSLYREFYTTLMTVVPDFGAQARRNARRAKITVKEARQQLVRVYLSEVHKRVRVLLGKAIRVFEKNVLMAERVGVESDWVGRSRRQIAEIRRLLSASADEALRLLPRDGRPPEDAPPARREGRADPSEPAPARPGSQGGDPGGDAQDAPGRVIL